MKYAATTLLCLVVACASVSPARSGHLSSLRESATNVWRVGAPGIGGSGFLISSTKVGTKYLNHMVTAGHLAKTPGLVFTAVNGKHRMILGKLVSKHPTADLAVLVFTSDGPMPFLRLASEAPEFMDRLYAVGYHAWPSLRVTEGFAARLPGHMSCPVAPGASGGAVLNERGEVVGVVEAIAARTETSGTVSITIGVYHVSRYESLLAQHAWLSSLGVLP